MNSKPMKPKLVKSNLMKRDQDPSSDSKKSWFDMEVLPAGSASSKSAGQATIRCGICGQQFLPQESPSMPFCSKRCQQIDLGHWLNESYGLPSEGEDSPEQELE